MGYSKDDFTTDPETGEKQEITENNGTGELLFSALPLSSTHLLADLRKKRPLPPHRHLPSRKTAHGAENIDTMLQKEVGSAIQNYCVKEERQGVLNGYLTRWRHGDFGKSIAEKLLTDLKGKSFIESIDILNQFFKAPDTKYNNHSLTSYILDQLNKLLDNLNLSTFPPENGQYTSISWPSIQDVLIQYHLNLGDEQLSTPSQNTL